MLHRQFPGIEIVAPEPRESPAMENVANTAMERCTASIG